MRNCWFEWSACRGRSIVRARVHNGTVLRPRVSDEELCSGHSRLKPAGIHIIHSIDGSVVDESPRVNDSRSIALSATAHRSNRNIVSPTAITLFPPTVTSISYIEDVCWRLYTSRSCPFESNRRIEPPQLERYPI